MDGHALILLRRTEAIDRARADYTAGARHRAGLHWADDESLAEAPLELTGDQRVEYSLELARLTCIGLNHRPCCWEHDIHAKAGTLQDGAVDEHGNVHGWCDACGRQERRALRRQRRLDTTTE